MDEGSVQNSIDLSLDPSSSGSVPVCASPCASLGKDCATASLTLSSAPALASLSSAFLNFPPWDASPVVLGQVFWICVSGRTAWSRWRKLLLQHQGVTDRPTGTDPLYGEHASPWEIRDCCCMLLSLCATAFQTSVCTFL